LELPPSQADSKGKTFASSVTVNAQEADKPKQVEESQQPQKTQSAPTKRDGDIDEYQRRRIRLSDFI
jgi:flagellar biosynthesis GTPase FlhF